MSRGGGGAGGAPFPDVEHLHSVKIDVRGEWPSGEMLTVKEELRDKFGKYGEIGDVYITQSRNIAFVRFRVQQDAEEAIEAMDGKDIGGSEIQCSMSMQRKRMPDEFVMRAMAVLAHAGAGTRILGGVVTVAAIAATAMEVVTKGMIAMTAGNGMSGGETLVSTAAAAVMTRATAAGDATHAADGLIPVAGEGLAPLR
eukprot:CAMPEP_0172715036 /NCGR_PEP_ID=MMETSP1074-20121228/67313_1 /TAXON_ID=2916 /ORGANISM="Ceratium fusus, Strain PA161109" /LENGTH=197 /DNA_ID=CAMNT_0013539571 /DNA_START=35 /DNA_END=629 /DNA_ORIENTATION=+